jgi:hypothetical protein
MGDSEAKFLERELRHAIRLCELQAGLLKNSDRVLPETKPPEPLIRLPELLRLTGLSKRTIYRLEGANAHAFAADCHTARYSGTGGRSCFSFCFLGKPACAVPHNHRSGWRAFRTASSRRATCTKLASTPCAFCQSMAPAQTSSGPRYRFVQNRGYTGARRT